MNERYVRKLLGGHLVCGAEGIAFSRNVLAVYMLGHVTREGVLRRFADNQEYDCGSYVWYVRYVWHTDKKLQMDVSYVRVCVYIQIYTFIMVKMMYFGSAVELTGVSIGEGVGGGGGYTL